MIGSCVFVGLIGLALMYFFWPTFTKGTDMPPTRYEDKTTVTIGCGFIILWIFSAVLSIVSTVALVWLVVAGIQYLGRH